MWEAYTVISAKCTTNKMANLEIVEDCSTGGEGFRTPQGLGALATGVCIWRH